MEQQHKYGFFSINGGNEAISLTSTEPDVLLATATLIKGLYPKAKTTSSGNDFSGDPWRIYFQKLDGLQAAWVAQKAMCRLGWEPFQVETGLAGDTGYQLRKRLET